VSDLPQRKLMRKNAPLAKAYAQITRKLMLWVQSRNRIVAGPRAKAYALRDIRLPLASHRASSTISATGIMELAQ